jgi:hypothetical protein
MNTIKDLSEQWWRNFPIKRNIELLSKYHPDDESLYYKKIENIFYNEVILKWYVDKYGKIEFDYNEEEIKNIYLKEHSKEQPKVEVDSWDEVRKDYFNYVADCRLKGITYLDLFQWLEQHYTLTKK